MKGKEVPIASYFDGIPGGDNLSDDNMKMLLKLANDRRGEVEGAPPPFLAVIGDILTFVIVMLGGYLGGSYWLSQITERLL
jgi:hypothetical protein